MIKLSYAKKEMKELSSDRYSYCRLRPGTVYIKYWSSANLWVNTKEFINIMLYNQIAAHTAIAGLSQ